MRTYYLISSIALSILLGACSNHRVSEVKHSDLILGLASPVSLPVQSPAIINLNDYILDPDRLDSVTVEAPFSIDLDSSTLLVTVGWQSKVPPIAELIVWTDGVPSSILMLRSKKREVQLEYNSDAETVQVAGEFTGWSAKNQDFERTATGWSRTLFLDPGLYQYQLVINGKWILDPSNADSVDNNVGGYNSLLRVEGVSADSVPTLVTSTFDKENLRISFENEPLEIFALWENQRLPSDAVAVQGNEITIAIPQAARSVSRSTIRVWSYNRNGVSNDLYIPLSDGEPIMSSTQLQRTDWHTAQMYFMVVDRFVNGDTTNDEPVIAPQIHFMANYQGGDLAGIHRTLDNGYFKSLNINTLWVSPITQNPLKGYVEFPAPHRKFSGYHGYWPIANTKVDHRFGTGEEMRSLIEGVHGYGMSIILDFVSNHVHEDHPIVKLHPEWRTQLDLPDGTKNIRIWDEQRLTTWFDTFLPSLDHSIPEVTDMLSDTALFWVTEYGFDGFRHDAAKHIPQEFWRTLTQKVKREVVVGRGKPVLQIGETFGSRELIGSYIGSGMMDGKFDFNLYFDARTAFALDNEDFDRLGTSLQSSLSYYGFHHLMGNITGNHDLPRFISYASGALKFGEDEKEAGWSRDIQVLDPNGYLKLQQLIAFMWTIPGIPVLYYGDEFGMPGAGDPDNRRMMRFELNENEAKTLDMTQRITALRKDHLALIFGDMTDICANGKLMHYKRTYFNDEVIVAFNKDSVSHTLPLEMPTGSYATHFEGKLHMAHGKLELTLPPYGFEILTKN